MKTVSLGQLALSVASEATNSHIFTADESLALGEQVATTGEKIQSSEIISTALPAEISSQYPEEVLPVLQRIWEPIASALKLKQLQIV